MRVDRFVDTREKRRSLSVIIISICILYMAGTYARLATQLLFLQGYEDIFALLQIESIQATYIARVIIACIALPDFELIEVLKILCFSLRFLDIVSVVCLLLMCKQKYRYSLIFRMMLFISLLSLLGGTILALPALKASTLQLALTQLTYIGITFLLGSTCVMYNVLYVLLRYERHAYKEALRYRVEEIIE